MYNNVTDSSAPFTPCLVVFIPIILGFENDSVSALHDFFHSALFAKSKKRVFSAVLLFSNLCVKKHIIVKEYNQQNASDLLFCLHIVYGNDTAGSE